VSDIGKRGGIFAGCVLCGLGLPYSYQAGPAEKEAARVAAIPEEAGGTLEDRLWEVLLLVGVGEDRPANWDGHFTISGGEIHSLRGYRFTPPDRILPDSGWRLRTQSVIIAPESTFSREYAATEQKRVIPKGVLMRGSGTSGTRVTLAVLGQSIVFSPMEMTTGAISKFLDGRLEVWRVPASTDLSGTELRQHDFPAIASAKDGTLWATWKSYHDQREELNLRVRRNERWSRLIPVARASEDLWRPQVAVDGAGTPWLVWAQQAQGNWDIYAMPRDSDETWGTLQKLSDGALPDIEPHVAAAADGTIYVVWQSWQQGHSKIRMRYLRNGKWSNIIPVSEGDRHDWEPAIAAGPGGRAWMEWDRYNGSYDVYARSFSPGSGLGAETKIAGTDRFEAHASVTVDRRNRPWVAWESGGPDWGKDLGMALGSKPQGSPLGDRRRIEVVCLEQGEWRTPAAFASSDALVLGSAGESNPLLSVDGQGDLWMSFRRRYSFRVFDRSVYWETFLTRLEGERWSQPVLLPESWGRNSARMGLASAGGRLWSFWTHENRDFSFAGRPRQMRVLSGSLPLPPKAPEPRLARYQPAPPAGSRAGHADEPGDVSRLRAHGVSVRGESFRLLRGELHRHTEISQDLGGLGDGTLPEFYRYVIDAAALDFAASTDHNGGGVDYWTFMAQECADMYQLQDRFAALYGYERSLPRPHGHRNMIHTRRNYSVVPFFQRIHPQFMLPDTPDGELVTQNSGDYGGVNTDDTRLLYEELRKSGGLAIPHTTAGANEWRDNDPALDPVMEIYQGARQSAEHPGAPRGRSNADFGYAWDAWKKGYRIGVISSSDHYSTHISYGMVYAKANTRQAVFDAIRQRRTYGATDNILLEFWLGDHFMGEDFTTGARSPIRVKYRGTGIVASVQLIRDGKYIHQFSPNNQEGDLEFEDVNPGLGQHWYYVRLEQQDGQLASSSPIWVRHQ